MKLTLALAVLALGVAAGSAPAADTARTTTRRPALHAGWKTYRNPALGISFEYRSDRWVVPCSAGPAPGEGGCVKLMGRKLGTSDYLMAFSVLRGALEPVAEEEAGFTPDESQPGQWITTFGLGQSTVERFAAPGWQGMEATISCGVSDKETGFHAAGGSCYWAVLSNGQRAVVIDTEGLLGNDDDSMRSVRTFRFLK